MLYQLSYSPIVPGTLRLQDDRESHSLDTALPVPPAEGQPGRPALISGRTAVQPGVEPAGVEPATYCMPCKRSTN